MSAISDKANALQDEAAELFECALLAPSNALDRGHAARIIDCVIMASVLRIMEKQAEEELCRAQSQNP